MELTKVVSSAVLALTLAGCNKILDIEAKHLAAPGPTDCPLVTNGLPAVRVMNAIPGSPSLDLCHKPSNQGSYGTAWFSRSTNACGAGVSYAQFTRNLAITPGTLDFKLVPAGSNCAADGVEVTDVVIDKESSITLMAYGADLGTAHVATLPNRTAPTNSQPVRFVHALNNAGLITAGLRSQSSTDTMAAPLYVNIEYGRASPASKGVLASSYDDVDAMGYAVLGGPDVPQLELQFGVQLSTAAKVTLAAPVPVIHGHAYTIFALGTNGLSVPRPKIWSCDENADNGLFLTCGNPSRLAVEVFDPNITDAFTPSIHERSAAAVEAILMESTDLLCVTELYDPAVVEQLKTQQSPVFQHRLFADDVAPANIVSLTKTVAGTEPTYPAVACPGEFAKGLSDWLECAKNVPGCTTTDSSRNNETVLTSPGEMAVGCLFNCGSAGPALEMIAEIQAGGRPEAGSCYWCGITHLASYETFESTLRQCTTDVPEPERRHMAFGGSSGLAVFSRDAELGNAELFLLPSSGWQRAAMRVPVTLKNGAVFDYWCTTVRFPNTEDPLSYAGPYGTWGTDGSAEEQAFEVATAAEIINKRAQESGNPAIVGIVAHAGPEVIDTATSQIVVHSFASEIYDVMGGIWPELAAPGYTPACTFCGDSALNPLNSYGETYRLWTTHLFGIGIDASAVESTSRTFMDRTVTLTDLDGSPLKVPVSQHFGLRSVVMMTQ